MSSRSRPRNGSTKGDSGEQEEEQQIWESIKSGLRELSEIQKRQIVIFEKIKKLEEDAAERIKSTSDEGGATVEELTEIQDLYRENLKLAENEKAMLEGGPHDIKNRLTILKAMREASNEAQTLSAPVPNHRGPSGNKPRKPKPLQRPTSAASSHAGSNSQNAAASTDKDDADGGGNAGGGAPGGGDGASDAPGPIPGRLKVSSSATRSPSVHSRRGDTVDRDLPDEGSGATGSESSRGTAAERAGKLVKGAEVAYKQARPKEDGSQWIQCIITLVQSEKSPKRYEVQDTEPEEKGAACAKYRTTAQTLIAIPSAKDSLPDYPVGKRVLARYPETTTFYDAEVLGNKKEKGETWCVLRFEDDQNKELRVLRRYVLDVGGK